MNKVKVIPGSVFEVGQGALVELDEQQVASRKHRLEAVDANTYRVAGNVQFKGGEVLRVDVVDKSQANFVEVLEAAPPPAPTDEHTFNTPKRGRPPLGKR